MARNLSRNTELYISTVPPATFNETNCEGALSGTSLGDNNTWKLNVLDGYSFSQDVATQEIGVSESASECTTGGLARGTLGFNTALNPVDVSFSTYVRPWDDGGAPNTPELSLWAAALGNNASLIASPDDPAITAAVFDDVTTGPDSIIFTTVQSDINELLPLYLYFVLDSTTYVVEEFSVNTVEVDFSIDGIATLNWSGSGTAVNENEAIHNIIAATTFNGGDEYVDVPTITEAPFLRNKLSTLELIDNQDYGTPDDSDTFASVSNNIITLGTTITDLVYAGGRVLNVDSQEWAAILENSTTTVTVSSADEALVNNATNWNAADVLEFFTEAQHSAMTFCIPITAATLTLDNGITYLTPEELGTVNQPLAGFTGSRTISGSFTAYLNTGAMGTGGLLQDLLAKITEVNNDFKLIFHMGNDSASYPRVDFTIEHSQIAIPTTNVEDVISTEISFVAKSWDNSTGTQSFENANEMLVAYQTSAT